ncbi:hypothetical protein [Streptosporangium amethystogenes]|uniref:hypothetical protein n=1 Tax=Streptosporangium amethystogenes TaxID=2002 RepID=UPI0004C9561B|nr:hypothetical protein [Streptosporangium amethystogenes]
MDTMVTVVSTMMAPTCALFGLWLRLRWRVRHEEVRGRHLVRMAEAITDGGRLEFEDEWGARGHLRVRMTRTPAHREDRTT